MMWIASQNRNWNAIPLDSKIDILCGLNRDKSIKIEERDVDLTKNKFINACTFHESAGYSGKFFDAHNKIQTIKVG